MGKYLKIAKRLRKEKAKYEDCPKAQRIIDWHIKVCESAAEDTYEEETDRLREKQRASTDFYSFISIILVVVLIIMEVW